MKKWKIWIFAASLVLLTGCGKEAAENETKTETAAAVEIETEAQTETQTQADSIPAETLTPAQTLAESEASSEEQPEKIQAGDMKSPAEDSKEPADNFDVDSSEAAEFAGKVKAAVSEQNLEALADLAAYPLYIGFSTGGQSVESREDFLSLGKEKIFTEELMTSVSQADETALTPSQAGFILTKESGSANIVFGLRDGKLAVSGINY